MDCTKNISMNVKMCAMRSDRPGSSKRSIAANNCYLLANCRDHGCSTSLCSGMRSCAYVYTFGSKNMYYNNPRVRFNATQGHQRASHILMDNSTEFGVERRSISIDSTPHRSSSCPCSSSTTSSRRLDLLRTHSSVNGVALEKSPLLVRAARGEAVERPPVWMMRQAGRYMKSYRELAKKYPSFRVRSETTELAVETTLQPFHQFKPDGVILFSDILTPLPAIGVPFEIDDLKGPILEKTIRSSENLSTLHNLDLDYLSFVGDALKILKSEVNGTAALLGFVGSPWTLATYIVEGGTSRLYQTVKNMCYTNSPVLHSLLQKLADAIAEYISFQIDCGADCVQIFDSWGGQLPPNEWDTWSKPYIKSVVEQVKLKHPGVPLALYVNGSGGLLERMADTGVEVIGLDWTVDILDARERMGGKLAVQGNVDPSILFTSPESIESAIKETVKRAGATGHILNLGHGVLVGTPEDNVAHFFSTARKIKLPTV